MHLYGLCKICCKKILFISKICQLLIYSLKRLTDSSVNNIIATKFDEIILFDHLTAIFCYENNLKFTYLRKKKTFRSLNALSKQASEVSLGIDKKIRRKFKNSYNFYYIIKEVTFNSCKCYAEFKVRKVKKKLIFPL